MRVADCDLRAAVQEKYPVKGLFQRKQGGIAVLGLEFTFPNDNGVPTFLCRQAERWLSRAESQNA